jgi:hypothetical protein
MEKLRLLSELCDEMEITKLIAALQILRDGGQ